MATDTDTIGVTEDLVKAMFLIRETRAAIEHGWRDHPTLTRGFLLDPLAVRLLDRIHVRLEAKLERHLFGVSVRVDTEAQATQMVMGLATELKGASGALLLAAEALKAAGKVMEANRAYAGHLRSKAEAGAYLGAR
jgi:hypothetical protein